MVLVGGNASSGSDGSGIATIVQVAGGPLTKLAVI